MVKQDQNAVNSRVAPTPVWLRNRSIDIPQAVATAAAAAAEQRNQVSNETLTRRGQK